MTKLEKHLNVTDLTLLSASTIIGGGYLPYYVPQCYILKNLHGLQLF